MTWPTNNTPEHLLEGDAAAGFEIKRVFACSDQMNDMFTRAI
ncbi:hypothetical protein [Octadecabacter antarcticus]|nr:hypothetical protein [Octadecabacter antarcticus]